MPAGRRRTRRRSWPQAVVQHRARVGREAGQPARAACGRLLRAGLDQLRRLPFPAPPGREHHRGIRNRRVPGRLRYQVIFFDQPRCRGQLAGQNVGSGQVVERERQVHEGPVFAGELDLASGQAMPGLEVPQLHGDDLADSAASEPEPAAGFAGADVQRENHLERPVKGGAAAACPSVSRSANASSRTSTARGGSGPGGAVRAASAASRRRRDCPGRWPTRGLPRASRCVSRARPASSGSSRLAALSSSRAASRAAPLVQGDLPAQPLHLGGLQLDPAARPRPRPAAPAPHQARRRRAWPGPPRAAAAPGGRGRGSASPRVPGTRPPRPGPRGPAPGPPSAPAPRRYPHPGPARPGRGARRGGRDRSADR